MGGATREFFVDVTRDALRVIDEAGADYLVIGGLATRALLGIPIGEDEDLDVLIRPEDADGLLEAFSRAGYSTYRRDERWIYKVAMPDVTVDLIFRAGEVIRLDQAHLDHSRSVTHEELDLRVPAPEDLVVMKAVFDAEDRQGRWYGALKILRKLSIDWRYLAARGETFAPKRILSLLLYAQDEGIEVPGEVVSGLMDGAGGGGGGGREGGDLAFAGPDEERRGS